jgi:hypothetical protein
MFLEDLAPRIMLRPYFGDSHVRQVALNDSKIFNSIYYRVRWTARGQLTNKHEYVNTQIQSYDTITQKEQKTKTKLA